MSGCRRRVAWVMAWAALALAARGEDKAAGEKKEGPRVMLVSSPSLVRGRTNKLVLRGTGLADVSGAWVEGYAPTTQPTTQPTTGAASQPATARASSGGVAVRVTSKGKGDPPKPYEAAKAGDSQVELEVDLPARGGPAVVRIVLAVGSGRTTSPAIHVLNVADVTDEREPNDGFRAAQLIELGKVVRGVIQSPKDVDVFAFRGRAGQSVRIEVTAARAGSLLDSVVTLYDAAGHVVETNDDGGDGGVEFGADSLIVTTLAGEGTYFVSVTDANESGSALHGYELRVK